MIVTVAGILIYVWPRSDEAVVATFVCGDGLSWNITTGHTMSETYGGQIDARACEYHRAELFKSDKEVFSVANFTDCRDFKTELDLYNGTGQPHWGYRAFPAGAPIIGAVAVPDVAVPISDSDFFEVPNQLGFPISDKSGISMFDFQTASKCLLDHRNELQDVFGSIVSNTQPLSWLALIDESATYGPGDLPGTAQIFKCKNGFTYRTADENLFSLAPGDSPLKKDLDFPELGNLSMNDIQEAVIGFNGALYKPDRSKGNAYMSLPYSDHRLVDQKKLPASITECLDNRGVSLAAHLESLKTNNIVYKPALEQYVPKSKAVPEEEHGIAPTNEQNIACISSYSEAVDAAAVEYAKGGGKVSKALFYSPSLAICVGVVEIVNGNITDIETFNAATGETLNATANAKAFQDWSTDGSTSSNSQ